MALCDEPDGAAQIFERVNMGGVCGERLRKRLLLRTCSLMRKIEEVAELRVFGQHAAVHERRNLEAMRLDGGC